MSTQDNKRIVQAFMDLFEKLAISDILALMTDDATWEVVGKPHLYAGAGVKTKAQMARIWPNIYQKLDGRKRSTNPIFKRTDGAAMLRS